jgi:hypothetical protein
LGDFLKSLETLFNIIRNNTTFVKHRLLLFMDFNLNIFANHKNLASAYQIKYSCLNQIYIMNSVKSNFDGLIYRVYMSTYSFFYFNYCKKFHSHLFDHD